MDYEYVDKLLKEKGMSRRQLAIKAGISINNMSGWFRRRTVKIWRKYIDAIAEVLGVDPWFIQYTPEEKAEFLKQKTVGDNLTKIQRLKEVLLQAKLNGDIVALPSESAANAKAYMDEAISIIEDLTGEKWEFPFVTIG